MKRFTRELEETNQKKLIAGGESSQPTNSSPEPSRGIEDISSREKDPGET